MTLAGGCANKQPGARRRRQRALAGGAGLPRHRRLHDAQGPVRRSGASAASTRSRIDLGAARLVKDQGLADAAGQGHRHGAETRAAGDRGGGASLALLVFVFKDARFRANATQVAGRPGARRCSSSPAGTSPATSATARTPSTLETVYFATNTRTLESLSFVAPLAYTLELLMLWTDKSLHVSFGIASVLGVVARLGRLCAGQHAASAGKASPRWPTCATSSSARMLMGFGGVTALGCTIGQGIVGAVDAGASARSSRVAGIVAGSVATLKYMLWREENA
ncbi:MAG: YeeE/YedE family protein [Chromatiales bacterium]|nr:YeeE/YedE family protein [Chromatiales bacterium]